MNPYLGPGPLFALVLAGLRLDGATYRRVAADPRALHHCLGAATFGAIGLALLQSQHLPFSAALLVLFGMGIAALQLVVESAIVGMLGRGLLRSSAGFGAIMRPLALARAPGVLFLLAALPAGAGLRTATAGTVEIWLLVAFVVGVRAGIGCGWRAAVGLALAVWLVEHVPGALLGLLDSAPGVAAAPLAAPGASPAVLPGG